MSNLAATSSRSESSRRMAAGSFLAFLVGLSVTSGVAYVFTVGNTPVQVSYVIAVISLVYCKVNRQKLIPENLRHDRINPALLLFVAVAFLSLIPALLYSLVRMLPEDAPVTVLKGFITLLAGIFIYSATVSLRGYRRWVLSGLAAGVVLNAIVSALQVVAFARGSFFSLYSLFPQDAFVISAKWGIAVPVGASRIYFSRSSGLFLEASHLMVFMVCCAPSALLGVRSPLIKTIVGGCILFCALTTGSPNTLFLCIELLVLYGIWRRSEASFRDGRGKAHRHVVILLFISILFGFLTYLLANPSVIESFFRAIETLVGDLDVSSTEDTGTADRWQSMIMAMKLIIQYPFGAGWNMESPLLSFNYGQGAYASHSFFIRLMLELGVIGLVSYLLMVYSHVKKLLITGIPFQARAVALGIAFMVLAQFLNGLTLVPYFWVMLGLARGYDMDRTNSNDLNRLGE